MPGRGLAAGLVQVRDLAERGVAYQYYVEQAAAFPVSYTHLRAHETVLELVCRLLLEKTTKHEYSLHTRR